MRTFILQAFLTAIIAFPLLCARLPIAYADQAVPLAWESPTTQHLVSVFMVNSTEGWAVGGSPGVPTAAIIRWDGANWSNVTSPTSNTLSSVFMVDPSDGWAVGLLGTIIHWNGTSWNSAASPTTSELFSVAMTNSTEGWAVGMDGLIIRWTGVVWVPEFSTVTFATLLLAVALIEAIVLERGQSTRSARRGRIQTSEPTYPFWLKGHADSTC